MCELYVARARCSYEAMQPSHLRRHLETHQVRKRFACTDCDYSANTLSYLKIHQTRRHAATSSSTAAKFVAQWHDIGTGLQCHICHYRFGNASDLKRHARLRHGTDISQPAHTTISEVDNISPTYDSNYSSVC